MFLETVLADAEHPSEEVPRQPSAIAGRWRSRLGSTMELVVDEHHRISGTFHTAVGTLDPSRGFSIVGFAEGDCPVVRGGLRPSRHPGGLGRVPPRRPVR